MRFFRKNGVTIIELLIVVAMIAAIASFSFLSLSARKGQNNLQIAGQNIAALLREARSRSVSQASSTGWGVHFENTTATTPFYALFSSSTYNASATVGYYALPSGVGYASSSIASGASQDITFSQITGLASASASVAIYLSSNPGNSSIISVASSGAVTY